MNWAIGVSWVSAWKARHAQRRSSEPDRADMGTAFGLDASFGPAQESPPNALDAPAEPCESGTRPWVDRLIRRTGL